MATRLYLLLGLAFTFFSASWSATAAEHTESSFVLHSPSAETLDAVSRLFGLEHRQGNDFEVLIPAPQADLLRLVAPQAELREADVSAAIRSRLHSFAGRLNKDGARYHSFAEVQSWMQQIVQNHPTQAQLLQYGKSQQGQPLLALHLNDGNKGAKPTLMITAATHGDELITVEVLMALVDQLLAGQGSDARLSAILAKHDLYFIPVVNPDGFTNQDRMDNGVDPNRSYPYPGHEDAQPTASIAGVMQFANSLKLAGSIDFHAYGELIMYPWAYTHDPIDAAHGTAFHNLTGQMAATNHYTFGPIADVIYVAPGSSADYYFWKQGSTSLGIEIGTDKVPDPSEFATYVTSQAESTWRFIESF
jgi:Zinc carboxypeptidase